MTHTTIISSLYVIIVLTSAVLVYDLVHHTLFERRFWIACGIIIYLISAAIFLRKGYVKIANWFIIMLYELLAAAILVHWGPNSSAGILTACFAMLLPSVLLIPRLIIPILLITSASLITIYTLHGFGVIAPAPHLPRPLSKPIDLIAYLTILVVFALVSWASARQSMRTFRRVVQAEERLRKQKDLLAVELERESARLRQAQLEQIQQLYKFALIGQSATATLHELANHLSILSLDIVDIKQQHQHSKAIVNAQEGIEYINRMVRKARAHLDTTKSQPRTFNALPTIHRAVKDVQPKFSQQHVKLLQSFPKGNTSYPVHGDPESLIQIISILLNNALDACKQIPRTRVRVTTAINDTSLIITISDTGPGIAQSAQKTLFQPIDSSKSSGLGVGLYIAKHLVESQLNGTLAFIESKVGATFQICITKASVKETLTPSAISLHSH